MIKYGKTLEDIMDIKSSFLSDNDKWLENNKRIAEIYKQQPFRTKCKLCGCELEADGAEGIIFESHGIRYSICKKCGHINGMYDDTEEFSEAVYDDDKFINYYYEEDSEKYNLRMNKIYVPKVQFLKNVLSEKEINLKVLDVGAGVGYFCGAAHKLGVDVESIEISRAEVEYANKMLGDGSLEYIEQNKLLEKIKSTECNVVSAIGVLEHIYNLREFLEEVKNNKKIHYLYFCVPVFSFSVFLESVFDGVYNRCLGGPHTHMFSDRSIEYMNNEFGFTIAGIWRFGSDVMDLYRALCCEIGRQNQAYMDIFQSKFLSCMDDLQVVLDKHNFSSEIHMIVSTGK